MFNADEYFRQIAVNHQDILHQDADRKRRYHRANGLSSLDEFLNTNTNGFNLVLVVPTPSEIIYNSGTEWHRPFYTALVMKNAKANDWNQITQVYSDTEEIVRQIIRKMVRDKEKEQNGLAELKRDRIPIFQYGPAGDNFFGTGFNFTILKHPGCFDGNKWVEDFELP